MLAGRVLKERGIYKNSGTLTDRYKYECSADTRAAQLTIWKWKRDRRREVDRSTALVITGWARGARDTYVSNRLGSYFSIYTKENIK